MEPGLLILLVVVTLGIIGALVLLGRRVSRNLERAASHELLGGPVKTAARIGAGVIAALGLLLAAMAGVPPETKLGAFIHEPTGAALVLAVSMLAVSSGGALYDRMRQSHGSPAPPDRSLERRRDR